MKRATLPKEQAFTLAAERATSWFGVHADQRLNMMNFYLIVLGAVLAGFAAALESRLPWFALTLSIVLLAVTYCFKKLDCRTAQLVKIGESALKEIEELLTESTGLERIELAKSAENRNSVPSYRETFNKLFFTGAMLGALGVIYSTLAVLECIKS